MRTKDHPGFKQILPIVKDKPSESLELKEQEISEPASSVIKTSISGPENASRVEECKDGDAKTEINA
jgi:DTW domain-containing protein YfiP